jgi:hypothetical protein
MKISEGHQDPTIAVRLVEQPQLREDSGDVCLDSLATGDGP